MGIDVSVVRVFTDQDGNYGNPLGIVDAQDVPENERQALAHRLGFSETIFYSRSSGDPARAEATIYTPAQELPFAGHPTVGLSWWLRAQGTPIDVLTVPASDLAVRYDGDMSWIRAKQEWTPHFVEHHLDSAADVDELDAASFADDHHYAWAWTDEGAGHIRSRMFAPSMGIAEDEATGAAAVWITGVLGRALVVAQGRGSVLVTGRDGDWIELGGRTVSENTITV
ncbi:MULTISPECIES: PhzF family phenazine biosynthesis protein [Nocardiaceae]|uniref:PhzF family phenazine biosynthesis protein n=1 Tax=Nocardiaceae TaxID=85025 RepID=UPI000564F806|nr:MULTISPECIES: PhzF family phenazine biosynthesis protein [Rhodococcus]OZE94883.1 PhzF family phenazine biosynthesis protein [Rhodococcus sp. 15-1189-1-1a]OZF09704.1 PhzF family phenazine biosynthesis protein [Rhodococcus sp. 14-2686-1-2]OZF42768.1 PhzF family phenazine biosynthesis protein [Rhodococcus sp. 14-2470-1b]